MVTAEVVEHLPNSFGSILLKTLGQAHLFSRLSLGRMVKFLPRIGGIMHIPMVNILAFIQKSLKVALKKESVPHKLVRVPGTNIYCLAINDKIENIFRRAAFLYRLLRNLNFTLILSAKCLAFRGVH